MLGYFREQSGESRVGRPAGSVVVGAQQRASDLVRARVSHLLGTDDEHGACGAGQQRGYTLLKGRGA